MKITVIGSINTDLVVRVGSLPSPGETVIGDSFKMNGGGKGANQAVAAARLGGEVAFVCKVGKDAFGALSRKRLEEEGLDTRHVQTDETLPSGVALIMVDEAAENCIAVASGANHALQTADVTDAVIEEADLLLLQMEIPVPTVEGILEKAARSGKRVILNPAPAARISPKALRGLYVMTPNRKEAEMLTGIRIADEADAERAAAVLAEEGVENVVITLNAKGAYLYNARQRKLIPGFRVRPVDTTAAGDVFNGALAVALAEGMDMEEAVRFANKAASISVTRYGAQSSAPYRREMEE